METRLTAAEENIQGEYSRQAQVVFNFKKSRLYLSFGLYIGVTLSCVSVSGLRVTDLNHDARISAIEETGRLTLFCDFCEIMKI